jgi:hypothetical protein
MAAGAGPQQTTVLVMPLQPKNGVTQDLADLSTTLLVGEVRRTRPEHIIAYQEVEHAMTAEQRRMLSGCDAASCMAEIAGALAAEQVVMGSLGKLGDNYLLGLTLLDQRTARSVGNVTRQFPQTEAMLARQIPAAVAELFLKPLPTAPPPPLSMEGVLPTTGPLALPAPPPMPSGSATPAQPGAAPPADLATPPGMAQRVLAPLFRVAGGVGMIVGLLGLLAAVLGAVASATGIFLYFSSIQSNSGSAEAKYRLGAVSSAGVAISLGVGILSLLIALGMASLFVVAATLD